MKYESPTTEKVQVALEGNVCVASQVFKSDPGDNADATINKQAAGSEGYEFEFDTFDSSSATGD